MKSAPDTQNRPGEAEIDGLATVLYTVIQTFAYAERIGATHQIGTEFADISVRVAQDESSDGPRLLAEIGGWNALATMLKEARVPLTDELVRKCVLVILAEAAKIGLSEREAAALVESY